MSTQSRELLESAAGLLEQGHPGLHVRFVRVMGRRLSHLAGSASPEPGPQVLVNLGAELNTVRQTVLQMLTGYQNSNKELSHIKFSF